MATRQSKTSKTTRASLEAASGELMTIPLSLLVPSPKRNVRRQGGDDVSGLKASIRALGLLQNLIVCPHLDSKGRATDNYEVVGGGRRRRALVELASEGEIGRDEPILCRVKPTREAAEASLAENVQREPMHPADEFEAFKTLIDEGKGVEDVAARFGLSPLTVRRRLKLAALSPKLLAEYRADRIRLDQLMTLAIVDDHARQEQVWAQAPEWQRDVNYLRAALMAGHIDSRRNALARFVTVAAYEEAGGVVVRDLFDDEQGGMLVDPALLQRLALQHLEERAAPVRAEGWSWVEARTPFPYADQERFSRAPKGRREPTRKERSKLDRLRAELAKAEAALAELDEEEGEGDAGRRDKLDDQCHELESALAELQDQFAAWTPEVMALAGAVITVDQQGQLLVHRGLVRAEDQRRLAKLIHEAGGGVGDAAEGADEADDAGEGAEGKPAVSEALARRLTAHRTAALQLGLAERPQVALAALLHPMVLRLIADTAMPISTPLDVAVKGCAGALCAAADDLAQAPAWTALQGHVQAWTDRIPAEADQLLPWLLAQPLDTLVQLLALCTALSANAVESRPERRRHWEGACSFDMLARATGLDMAQWWQPSVAGYLGQVPKARIVDAVTEAVSKEAALALAKLKKGEAAARAEQLLAGTRWLPPVLRVAQAEAVACVGVAPSALR